MDEGHTRMMAVVRARARAQGTLVSHLVRFHRQKCRRRICSFRHDAVAVDHPYCSPRESGSQTVISRKPSCGRRQVPMKSIQRFPSYVAVYLFFFTFQDDWKSIDAKPRSGKRMEKKFNIRKSCILMRDTYTVSLF